MHRLKTGDGVTRPGFRIPPPPPPPPLASRFPHGRQRRAARVGGRSTEFSRGSIMPEIADGGKCGVQGSVSEALMC